MQEGSFLWGAGGRDHPVATRNNSWKMKSGGISLSVISAAHVVHQSPSRISAAAQASLPRLLCRIQI